MSVRQLRWCLVGAVSACSGLSVGNTPVAIQFVQPPAEVPADSTLHTHLQVEVLDRNGDIVAAPVTLLSLDTLYLRANTADTSVTGLRTDSGRAVAARVVATTGTLQSIPISITVDTLHP